MRSLCCKGLSHGLLLGLVLGLVACAEVQDPADTSNSTINDYLAAARDTPLPAADADYSAIVTANNSLAVQLFHANSVGQPSGDQPPPNSVISAYGLTQVLAMLASGARGTSLAEFPTELTAQDPADLAAGLTVLNTQLNSGGSGFSLGNAVWGQEGYRFLTAYLDALTGSFGAGLTAVPFLPRSDGTSVDYWSQLDTWIEANTENQLDSSLATTSDYSDRIRLLLASATRLNATWTADQAATANEERLFDAFDGLQYWVPMVRFQGRFGYYQNEQLTAVDLPLVGDAIRLLVIAPTTGNYQAVYDSLSPQLLAELTGNLVATEQDVFIPEFSVTSEYGLNDFVQSLGISKVFQDSTTDCGEGCVADFSAINGQGHLRLDSMARQEIFGITAQSLHAASATIARLQATQDEPVEVFYPGYFGAVFTSPTNSGFSGVTLSTCVDTYFPEGPAQARPFIFVIRDPRTKAILYLGQLTDAGGKEAGHWECL